MIKPSTLAMAVSLLLTLGACSTGPTRPPYRPASSAANKAATSTPSAKAAAKPTPQVAMSPLQANDAPTIEVLKKDVSSAPPESASTATSVKPIAPEPKQPAQPIAPATDTRVAKVEPPPAKPVEAPIEPTPLMEAPKETQPLLQTTGQTALSDEPNQCIGQVTIMPTAKKKVVQLVTEQARTRYKLAQAKLRNEQLPVVIKEAAQSYKLEQPQYVQVTEAVKVQEEYVKLRVEPAVYRTDEQEVLVESARIGLRPCSALGSRLAKSNSSAQTSAQCTYEIPARYRKVSVQTLVKPEVVREEVVPAVYKNITKYVLAEPAKATPVNIPAKTIQLPFSSVEEPSSATPEDVQAVTIKVDVTEHEKKSPQLAWSRVLCESDLNTDLIREVQKALQREGKMPGTIDGKLGLQTLLAAKDYQRSKGVESNFIAYQLLEWLGVQRDQKR